VNGWGVLYRSWEGDSEWWPVTNSNNVRDFKNGYVFQSEVNSVKNKLGL
jgi:hypothetical protein